MIVARRHTDVKRGHHSPEQIIDMLKEVAKGKT
jgi:hypothetical protein